MANLSRDASLRFKGKVYTQEWVLDNSSAQTIYRGQPMILDQDVDTLYLEGFTDAVTVVSTDIFVGIAAEGASVATTDTETDNKIKVYVQPTVVGFKSTVVTDADVGDTVYMSDSNTLDVTTSTAYVQIGKLVRVHDGYAFVRLQTPVVCASA